MLDEKFVNISKKKVETFLKEGIIRREKEKKFIQFFLNNAKNSLEAAKVLFETSTNNKLKSNLGLVDFNGFLWVINTSYYSMFYMARALLESIGVKIKTELSIHSVTFDALVYYFYLSGKLQRGFVEDFAEAKEEAAELLGKEKAKELIEDYFYEKRKRAVFTYDVGTIAMQNKAQTSLERAKKFNENLRKMIEV